MTDKKIKWTKPVTHSQKRIVARGGVALSPAYTTGAGKSGIRRIKEEGAQ